MGQSFLELFRGLDNVDSAEAKEELSTHLSASLEKDKALAEALLRSNYKLMVKQYLKVADRKYLEVDCFTYKDVDDSLRIAVFVAILQDHEALTEDFDKKLLLHLVEETRQRHLDLLVNDISVNTVQYRDGKLTLRDLLGGGVHEQLL